MSGGRDSVEAMATCYDPLRPRWRQPLTGGAVIAVGASAVTGAVTADVMATLPVAAGLAVLVASGSRDATRWMMVVVVVVGIGAALRGAQEWRGLEPRTLGPHHGPARVIDDPRPFERVTRVILEVDGQRFEVWARGDALRTQVARWRGGDQVIVAGERRRLAADRAGRVAWQHVVGVYQLSHAGAPSPGSRIARGSNEVRAAIERGAAVLPGDDAALFRGLVVGDRRSQPAAMVERFRASGLSHLTVVSGLNVTLLLVLMTPGLRLLPPLPRWAATLALVAWFVALTRFEPSIVRAGMMAVISATAFVTGRDRAPARILTVAVIVLVLIDPLLVRSLGFWLSVGATAGVCTVGPRLAERLSVLGVLAAPLGITVGAQIGVAIPLVAAFGHLPVVSVPANLVAVPVASLVKLYGLPAGLLAGWVPPLAEPLMLPVRFGVRWVDTVAGVAARSEPPGAWSWVAWGAVIAVLAVVLRASAATTLRNDRPPPHR